MKMNKNNTKFYGSYCKKRNGELQMRAIKEVVRIIDGREKEKEYINMKYGYRKEFIDMGARNKISDFND